MQVPVYKGLGKGDGLTQNNSPPRMPLSAVSVQSASVSH